MVLLRGGGIAFLFVITQQALFPTAYTFPPVPSDLRGSKNLGSEEISAPPCSLQHYSQEPRSRNNLCPTADEWIKKMWYVYAWNKTQP